MLKSSSALYLQAPGKLSQQRPPSNVTVSPVALFSILDHYLRREHEDDQAVGALLGVRSENNVIEIKTSFPVPHKQLEGEKIFVDFDHFKTMYELHHKVNSKEVIVGWYSTGSELNSYSASIHNHFSEQVAPLPIAHLLVGTGAQKGAELGVKAYVSAPLGVTYHPDNCVFVPVACELRFQPSERAGLDLVLSASKSSDGTAASASEIETLETTVRSVIAMVDRVLAYVRSVISGETKGNVSVAKVLLDNLSDAQGFAGLEKSQVDSMFNNHLQDTLMVSYLAALVRSQVEISTRLALIE